MSVDPPGGKRFEGPDDLGQSVYLLRTCRGGSAYPFSVCSTIFQTLPYDHYDPMHMVRHDGEFVQFDVWVMLQQVIPGTRNYFSLMR